MPAWTVQEPGTSFSHPDWVFVRNGRIAWDGAPELKLVHRLSAIWVPVCG